MNKLVGTRLYRAHNVSVGSPRSMKRGRGTTGSLPVCSFCMDFLLKDTETDLVVLCQCMQSRKEGNWSRAGATQFDVATLGRGFMDRLHNVEDMVSHLAVCPLGCVCLQGMSHI